MKKVEQAEEIFNIETTINNTCSPNFRYCITSKTIGDFGNRRTLQSTLLVDSKADSKEDSILFIETNPLVRHGFQTLSPHSTHKKITAMRKKADSMLPDNRYFVSDKGNVLKVSLDEKKRLKLDFLIEGNCFTTYNLYNTYVANNIDPNQYNNAIEQAIYIQPLPDSSDRNGNLVKIRVLDKELIVNIDTKEILN